MPVKNLLKSAFTIVVIFSASSAFAQEPMQQQQQMPKRTPEQRATRQTQWMQKNLMLTDEQNKKVYNIILNAATEQENASTSPQKGERKAIARDEAGELKQVLTPDQFQKYMAHVQEMKEKNKERKAGMQQGPY